MLAETSLEALFTAFEEPLPAFERTPQPSFRSEPRRLDPSHARPRGTLTTAVELTLKAILLAIETPHPPLQTVANRLPVPGRGRGCRRQHENCDDSPKSSHVLSFEVAHVFDGMPNGKVGR